MTNLNLDAILLTIEEVKIPASGHSIVPVIVPIHPRLIEDKTLKFDTELPYAEHIFVEAVKSWRAELEEHYEQKKYEDDSEKSLCEMFLDGELEIIKQKASHGICGFRASGYEVMPGDLDNGYILDERGFARCFMIEEGHGSIGFDAECHLLTHFPPGVIDFSIEKRKEYTPTFLKKSYLDLIEKHPADVMSSGYAYTPHNVFNVPHAMFLRQWAVAYHNECLKQIIAKPKPQRDIIKYILQT
jgi:hypothetical protein